MGEGNSFSLFASSHPGGTSPGPDVDTLARFRWGYSEVVYPYPEVGYPHPEMGYPPG